ncbi:MAG: transposase [Nitrospinaceae bacterium]|nr:transposase [Nitrospinaceae bacterium]
MVPRILFQKWLRFWIFRLLGKELSGIYGSSTGRPPYTLILLFKTLNGTTFLTPACEEALTDRISFHRFVSLSLSDAVPDHSTISRFRSQLGIAMKCYFLSQTQYRAAFIARGLKIKE